VTLVYVGVGANLGDRRATIARAVAALGTRSAITVQRLSTLRETEPWGLADQPRFLNGVIEIETGLEASELLATLLEVERELGRTRGGQRWGPRVIDLDVLVFGGVVVDEPGLTIPHPMIAERRFVLEPLTELDPELDVPGAGRVGELLALLDEESSS
jgi:2-amino-4-hydroxy-6-hydroxymethyldihydropteridine diphosphokinase